MPRAGRDKTAAPAGAHAGDVNAHPLPTGRHGLAREHVVRSQRHRLLHAIADVTAEKGYSDTTVADILTRAGVSRKTFYEQFASKQDCFVNAYDMFAHAVFTKVIAAAGESGTVLDRVDRALAVYLDTLAGEPTLAYLYQVEGYAAGGPALREREQVEHRFATILADALGAREDSERFACEALIAAVGALVSARLAAHDINGLRGLHRPLVDLVTRVAATWTAPADAENSDHRSAQPAARRTGL